MSTVTRLALYLAGLIVTFGVMFLAGRALIPEDTVATWTREAEERSGEHEGTGEHGDPAESPAQLRGLSIEQDGYRLSAVEAPARAGESGELSFRILDPDGEPLTDFETTHEKDLHLIVVRADGAGYRHVHPTLDRKTGIWSTPWTWPEGGTYRVFADFVPGDSTEVEEVTLAHSVDVAGDFTPVQPATSPRDTVDGFEVNLRGDLEAGAEHELAFEVTRNGRPVTELQPYLGAFGHLVALREGDLAYLHVHAEDEHDEEGEGMHGGETAGPEIHFVTEAPTPGRYLMYLDFKVDGVVHSAEFVLEAK